MNSENADTTQHGLDQQINNIQVKHKSKKNRRVALGSENHRSDKMSNFTFHDIYQANLNKPKQSTEQKLPSVKRAVRRRVRHAKRRDGMNETASPRIDEAQGEAHIEDASIEQSASPSPNPMSEKRNSFHRPHNSVGPVLD